MTKYNVWAESEGVRRMETIDSETNELFKGVKTAKEVKKRYEAFWSLDKYSPVVKVLMVKKVR